MEKDNPAPLIYIVTGEASGDLIGAQLMRSLKKKRPSYRIEGVGGPLMAQEGLSSLFPMSDLAVMGIFEILPHLPRLLRRLAETKKDILAKKPAVVVTIDSPGFNFRLARQLSASKNCARVPLVHYTAPSVWAWKPGRAKKIAEIYDHLLALFSFEPPYFIKENLPCTFVGHPLIEQKLDSISPDTFQRRHALAPSTPLICLLPGSRKGEVKRLLPSFAAAIHLLKGQYPTLTLVCPTLPAFQEAIQNALGPDVPILFTKDSQEKYQAMAASQAALAASGTVSLELALTKTPMVIGYRMQGLTYALVKRLVKSPYACLVNILLKAPAVPEYIQENCTPEALAEALSVLLSHPEAALKAQRLEEIPSFLQSPAGTPSDLAAQQILSTFEEEAQKVSADADCRPPTHNR